MRLAADGSPLEILSDGTESYFYGSLYFDNGTFSGQYIWNI